VADELQRLMPREDVVLIADHAYAPYARRPGAVVCDRVTHMVEALRREYGCKLVVLASLQATLDAQGAIGAVGMTLAPAVARAAASAGCRSTRPTRPRSARPSWPRSRPCGPAARCAGAALRPSASGSDGAR
jgi:hypothetical protein